MTKHAPPESLPEFTKLVQDALNRLYDSPYLQTHPLGELLVESQGDNLAMNQDLRRILLQAIRAVRPQPGTPARSADWRNYRILELRYIEGLNRREVMEQLALSRSQYFRDQARIVETLATHLWTQWQQSVAEAATEGNAKVEPALTSRDELAQTEAKRLWSEAQWQALDIVQLLTDLRVIIDPLARAKGVTLHFAFPHTLTGLRADRVMLRQTLLNSIMYALDKASTGEVHHEIHSKIHSEIHGEVRISSFLKSRGLGIAIIARWQPPAGEAHQESRAGVGLNVSKELMAAMGGALEVSDRRAGEWSASLLWPKAVAPVLLVIDDNEGFIQLCRRYLAALRWQVIGANSAAEAREVVRESKPTVILLDIMMPKEDGWELLATFKADPQTQEIPMIVCSVLNEPTLAAMLGASQCLTKPLSQQTLLQALAPWNLVDATRAPTP